MLTRSNKEFPIANFNKNSGSNSIYEGNIEA